MAQIKSEAAYRAALKRIDELLPLVNDETPTDDKNYLELDMISDMVEEYEDVHYPIGKPILSNYAFTKWASIRQSLLKCWD